MAEDGPFGERTWLAQMESGLRWWERMRLIYNLIMLLLGMGFVSLFLGPAMLLQEGMWFGVVAFGIMCNVCYFLGPLLDMYATVFSKGRLHLTEVRWILFALGTFLSVIVMFAILATAGGFGDIATAD